jgi:hypothetical protein
VATHFQGRLASIALREHKRFHLLRENQDPLASRIVRYWTDLGFEFPGIQVPWSAVFVSWCVKSAGATAAQFEFAAAHSQFVFKAIANTVAGQGDFRGYAPDQYAPKVGDIVQNNRAGKRFDFAFASTHRAYQSHSAIVVEVGSDDKGQYLRTVGGNESDSVGVKEVRLSPAGRVMNSTGLYVAVVETRL